MHYNTLVTAEIPSIIEAQENQKTKTPKEEVAFFTCAVENAVDWIMEPYDENTENDAYLEFEDETPTLRSEYEECVDCLKLPDGSCVELFDYPYGYKYTIIDNKVYQRDAGPLRHNKRTKKAKKITALPSYPRKKLYKTFKEYAEDYRGYRFNDEQQTYGYYFNPNSVWDWYQIGGRWPDMFLVKTDCREYSLGKRSWGNADKELKAPDGYMWVAAARKKDIQWDVMRNWKQQKSTEAFYRLKKMFEENKLGEDLYAEITEDGIYSFGCCYYKKDETLEEYLERVSVPNSWRYPFSVYDIIECDEGREISHSELDEYLDNLDEDTVLIGVDYHN